MATGTPPSCAVRIVACWASVMSSARVSVTFSGSLASGVRRWVSSFRNWYTVYCGPPPSTAMPMI